jgi:hypothetical protein
MKNFKLKIKKAALAGILHFAFCIFNCSATPFFIQGFQSDSPALTNKIGVAFYPATGSQFVTYGTNLIYGGNIVTITPNGSGYSSNWLYPGTYRFYFTNLNASFVADIPDTTNFNSLALYVTNIAGFSGVGLNSYGVVTNLLGLAPATNTTAGIEAALGYVPATNNLAGILFALGFTPPPNTYGGITNSLGFAPPTNNYSGLTNALGFPPATNTPSGIKVALGYTPPASNSASVIGALGFAPATNTTLGVTTALGYTPPTNTYSGLTNALGLAPATNSTSGIDAALGYVPRTNDGYTGLPQVNAWVVTNGFTVWVSLQTNGVPGIAYTNEPQGSILTTTNGAFFVLSNLVWNPK